jgi:hypothetical protein
VKTIASTLSVADVGGEFDVALAGLRPASGTSRVATLDDGASIG